MGTSRAAADAAESRRAPLSKAYVDANPQGTTNAERWTWRVAASPWGRAVGVRNGSGEHEGRRGARVPPTTTTTSHRTRRLSDETPDNKTTESWREISGWEWIEHLRKLTIRKITDDSRTSKSRPDREERQLAL